jgi:hypothetical protein
MSKTKLTKNQDQDQEQEQEHRFEITKKVILTGAKAETAVYSAHYQSIMPAVSVTATSTSTNVTNVTNQRNRLESIPENGEIPDPVLQSTTNNASCLVTTETSRNRRELSYMDSSNIIRSKRRRKE